MSDAFWMALFGFLATIVSQTFAYKQRKRAEAKLDIADKKIDHNIELSNSMLSQTVAKKDAAEQKLEQTHAQTLTELKTKLAEKEATIALLTKTPGSEMKDSGEVRPFRPDLMEGGKER